MLLKLSFRLAKKNPPTTNKQQSRVDSDKKKTPKKQDRLYTYEENMDDGVKFQN